jgi:spore maturation protein CgeB
VCAKKEKPDLCLITRGTYTWPSAARKIKKLGIKTVLWTIDPPCDFDNVIALARECDSVVCGGSEAIEILQNHGITGTPLVPFGCDLKLHKKVELTENEKRRYQHDIVFVGAWYPSREKLFERLHNYDLAIWGAQWDRVGKNSPLKRCIKGAPLLPEEWTKVYSASKIILVSHFQADNVLCYQASPKIYEGLACKGFILCNDQPDVVRLFKDGEHLVIFKDYNDLIQKIDHYLRHDDERERIALQGYNEVVRNHTYVHRIQTILDLIKER